MIYKRKPTPIMIYSFIRYLIKGGYIIWSGFILLCFTLNAILLLSPRTLVQEYKIHLLRCKYEILLWNQW